MIGATQGSSVLSCLTLHPCAPVPLDGASSGPNLPSVLTSYHSPSCPPAHSAPASLVVLLGQYENRIPDSGTLKSVTPSAWNSTPSLMDLCQVVCHVLQVFAQMPPSYVGLYSCSLSTVDKLEHPPLFPILSLHGFVYFRVITTHWLFSVYDSIPNI